MQIRSCDTIKLKSMTIQDQVKSDCEFRNELRMVDRIAVTNRSK